MQYPTQRFLTADGREIHLIYDPQENTVWATQKQISWMFHADVSNINLHIQNIEAELGEAFRFRYFRVMATNRKMYNIKHYDSQIIEMIRPRIRRSGKIYQYEKEIFHGLVENFLFEKGFTQIQHEVTMPIQGKADFLAYQPDQKLFYVIECKVEQFKTRHYGQAWDYAQQICWQNEQNTHFDLSLAPYMPAVVLAYPMKYGETIAWEYCQRLGVSIILIEDDNSVARYPLYENLLNCSLPSIT